MSDRKYMFSRTRNRGLRRRGNASRLAQNVENDLCSNTQNSLKVLVVSQAISGAVTQSSGREKSKTETNDLIRKSSDKSCSNSEKPNCYNCAYRGEIPGNAHSKCLHPKIAPATEDPFIAMVSMMGSRGFRSLGVNLGDELGDLLGVEGAKHGIDSGWFNWPLNFDPVWLLTCGGYTPKKGDL